MAGRVGVVTEVDGRMEREMRRLLRTLRQLDDKQLTAVGYMARSLVPPETR